MIQTGTKIGMHTMDDSLLELMSMGKITPEAARERASDPSRFR